MEALSTFGSWLSQLGGEADALCRLVEQEELPVAARRVGAESLNHLLWSVELIPEGLEALGHLEDSFAFRLLAQQALSAEPELASADASGTLGRLAGEAQVLAEFLGAEDHARLGQLVTERAQRGRGCPVQDLLEPGDARAAALGEARSWSQSYRPPSFGAGEQDLVKLQAFLRTRLRRAS
jgi:hypothetical protein